MTAVSDGNLARCDLTPAIQCDITGLTARNNIISNNGDGSVQQIAGSCGYAFSIVFPGPAPTGPGNLVVDPRFESPGTGDLHLQPGSPAVLAADPNADLSGLAARDIDGDLRVAPADIGADQIAR